MTYPKYTPSIIRLVILVLYAQIPAKQGKFPPSPAKLKVKVTRYTLGVCLAILFGLIDDCPILIIISLDVSFLGASG
jgi:hypothetical protein